MAFPKIWFEFDELYALSDVGLSVCNLSRAVGGAERQSASLTGKWKLIELRVCSFVSIVCRYRFVQNDNGKQIIFNVFVGA